MIGGKGEGKGKNEDTGRDCWILLSDVPLFCDPDNSMSGRCS